MPPFQLFLFGPPRLERDGRPVDISLRKAVALLAYLAVSHQSHSRDALATLFWPDADQRKARGNLRRALSRVNTALGEGQLTIDREQAGLDPQANLQLDVKQFQRYLAECETHDHPTNEVCPDCLPLLTNAVACYTDDFLAGFTLRDCPDFDEWQFFQSESLRQELASALERLVQGLSTRSDYEAAIPHARRRLALDPLHEPAHRQLMELYAQSGQQSAAVRQYNECVRILDEEFGVSPSKETTALYERIRRGDLSRGAGEQRSKGAGEHSPPHPRPPARFINQRFEIRNLKRDLIGQGSMGHVYRGTDTSSGLPVAVKVLKPDVVANHPDLVERFIREGEALRQLNHPNIVKMLAAADKDGQHYLVMEYISGGSLHDLLKQPEPLSIPRVVEIGLGLADALTRAHHLNIIHRDLKPANVLLTENGNPRLTDFGIARLADSPTLTQTGAVLGTVNYLSPEACQGESLDSRSDIWAFGVLLYEMLAGIRPFTGETMAATLTAILTQPVPDLKQHRPEIPLSLVDLIIQMLEKDPRQRIPSVRLVGAELEAILQGREEAGVQSALWTPAQRRSAEEKVPLLPSPPAPPHNLPPQPTSFIGRKKELAEIADQLANPACRLLTLGGPGGIGKTRLAIEAATAQIDAFSHGVTFVPLAPINPADFEDSINPLVTALADALKFAFHGSKPKSQLLAFLREKEMLLVLDNFEHLLTDAHLLADAHLQETVDFVTDILSHAPQVRILVTSRERLNLQEEWLFPLQGMTYPSPPQPSPPEEEIHASGGEGAEFYSAVQLFGERARQIQPDFDLDAEHPAVVRICQLVDGMPLGIELAATWVRLMPCQTIAQEIENGIDILTTTLRNVVERHRSLRAVFDHSWQLLSQEEKDVFKKLSVFRGGFLYEAGEVVGGASLPLLSALVDKSLLRRTRSGRYEIHALLRQYAAEKLKEDFEEYEAAQKAHAHHYAKFMQQGELAMRDHRQLETYTQIAADIDNIRATWRWAVDKKDLEVFEKSQNALIDYCEKQGYFQEAEAAFRRAVTALGRAEMAIAESLTERQAAVLGTLLDNQAWFTFRLGLPEAKALWQQSIAVLRRAGAGGRWELAGALSMLGIRLSEEDYAQADALLQEGLVVATEVGDPWLLGFVKQNQGETARSQGEYRAAVPHLQQSLDHYEQTGEQRFRSFAVNSWGRAAYGMGQHTQAEELLVEALETRRALGDQIGIAYSLLDLGKLARAQGRLAKARQQIEASLAICEEIGGRMVAPHCLNDLGMVAHLQGDFEEAEKLFQNSRALFKEMGHVSQLPLCLNNLGHLAYAQGAYQKAEQYLQESLAICQKIKHSGQMASTLRYLGHVAVSRDQCPEARQYFGHALEIVIRTGAAPVALDVLVGWATLLMANEPTNTERVQAIELLNLVQHHPAGEYETKEKAGRLLAEWTPALPPEMVTSAQTRGRTLDVWATASALLDQRTEEKEQSPLPSHTSAPLHNLPPQPTPFIGRETELTALDNLIAKGEMRLITVVGSGGIGKTRLALAAAERQLKAEQQLSADSRFSNGVYFVNLAPLSEADHIIPTMAEALDIPLGTGEQQTRTPKQQILDYLRQKQMLVVMDNFEHLLEGVELVADILQTAPGVQILATSRERLQLHEEQVYPIRGLAFPALDAIESVADSDAARLFLQSARRVQPNFEWQANDLSGLIRICNLLEGLPLGLELAAAWVDILSLADIVAEIQGSLDFLESEKHNIPERHRSMRAVFDTSWQRLSKTERDVFAQLSVFRGGFTRKAVQEVTGASLRVLAALANMSLLRFSRSRDRYEIHELLRQYGAEKLQTVAQTSKVLTNLNGSQTFEVLHVRDRHSAYYCVALHQREADLKGVRQKEAIAEIESDIENVRAAWEWAVGSGQIERLEQAIESLGIFYEWRGRYQEGEAAFRLVAEQLAATEALQIAASGDRQKLLVRILTWQSVFSRLLGHIEIAGELLEQCQTLLSSPALANQDTRTESAAILTEMGGLAHDTDYEQARRLYEQSLDLYRALGNQWQTANILNALAETINKLGDVSEAKKLLEDSLSIYDRLEDKKGIATALNRLSQIANDDGQSEEAERLARKSVAIRQEIGDRPGMGRGLNILGWNLVFQDKLTAAISALEESLSVSKDLGDRRQIGDVYRNLAYVAMIMGRYEKALSHFQKALVLAQEIKNQFFIGSNLMQLGRVALVMGAYAEAEQLSLESVAICRKIGQQAVLSFALAGLGYVVHKQGNALQAQQHFTEAVQIAIERQSNTPLGYALFLVAPFLADQGEHQRAVELYTLAEHNYPPAAKSSWHQDVSGRQIAAVAATLPPEVVEAAQARGRTLDLWETAAELLEELKSH